MAGLIRRRVFHARWSRFKAEAAPLGGAVAAYADAGPPDLACPANRLAALALDMETTGLDPKRDSLLSVGHVPLDGRMITLGGAARFYVRPHRALDGVNVAIHGLTDSVVAEGIEPTLALTRLFTALSGRILLAHHADLEVRFLQCMAQHLWGLTPPMAALDTLTLARRHPRIDPETLGPGDLKLGSLRARFHLPRLQAHEALADALGAAELFLALTAGRRSPPLGRLVRLF
ncbi:3'-5' exonuclease [Yunchengibacter salinarum]|uniref:3'-5' exonuclease n=1 Tax=Yunchengibacter salinarum TaxID=3133399 RepID=UPI0035B5CCBE